MLSSTLEWIFVKKDEKPKLNDGFNKLVLLEKPELGSRLHVMTGKHPATIAGQFYFEFRDNPIVAYAYLSGLESDLDEVSNDLRE